MMIKKVCLKKIRTGYFSDIIKDTNFVKNNQTQMLNLLLPSATTTATATLFACRRIEKDSDDEDDMRAMMKEAPSTGQVAAFYNLRSNLQSKNINKN
jgi:hypothetical protein